jgi:hypothetical protein
MPLLHASLALALGGDPAAAFATITVADLRAHLAELAAPELEGRDTPSEGLQRAGEYLCTRLAAAGLTGLGEGGAYRLPFSLELSVPDPQGCSLEVFDQASATTALVLEEDFVPFPGLAGAGAGEGEVVFVGFAIQSREEHFDDLKGIQLKDRVALFVEGEPRHKRLFAGPEVTAAADLRFKVARLAEAGARAALVVRRPPSAPSRGADGKPLARAALGYRYTLADWNPATTAPMPAAPVGASLPTQEITPEVAARLLGTDVLELAERAEKSGKPARHETPGLRVRLRNTFRKQSVACDNIAAVVPGNDPALAGEYVVVGAHYDHIGVDEWGRIGLGADDNASGTTAVLEIAQAFASAPGRRSVLVAFFAAEEDGLIGSQRFCSSPPVAANAIVAMLNLDMVGRGEADEAVVLGVDQNPDFAEILRRARTLHPTKVKSVITDKAEHLWERSDHYSFHQIGVPVLFFFEAVSESDNADYHTYRDSIERLDFEKIARTTRLTFNAAWLIANDDRRPPPPRK